jgi:aminoacrylate hydrolase
MPKVKIEDFEIYYEIYGKGTPVLLVPGLGGAGSYWNPNVAEFAKYFKVIMHDHRGTGQSTHSKIQYSVEQMTDDMIKLMDALDLGKVHLVGHSAGGAMGQIAAIKHPERLLSMVIYASWTKATPFMRRCLEMRRELLLKSGIEAYVKAVPIFLHTYWWVNKNIEKLEEMEKQIIKTISDPEIQVARIDGILAFDGTKYLEKKIEIPTLVCCAKDDILTSMTFSEQIAAAIPGAKTYWFKRGAHAVSQTLPEEFNRVVISFLQAHEKGEEWQGPKE